MRGYKFEHILQDIQKLNERATRGELHITAVSIHALAYVLDKYALLPSGASMGDGYGPMFVSTEGPAEDADDEARKTWLLGKTDRHSRPHDQRLPGRPAFSRQGFQHHRRALLIRFSTPCIPARPMWASSSTKASLPTKARAWSTILDLGEWWNAHPRSPLPLGGNVVRKDMPPEVRSEISDILRKSIAYGLEHRAPAVTHSMAHARGSWMIRWPTVSSACTSTN